MSEADAIRRYYATDRNLRIHEETQAKYSVPRIDFVRWTLAMPSIGRAMKSSSISAPAAATTMPA